MSPSTREFLKHILDETTYLLDSSSNLGKAAFLQDETLKRAYSRSIEVIGEAVKQLPEELCQKYNGVNWTSIARMRDKLIHKYFGVDYDIVWDVVANKVPSLDAEVRQMLKQEFGDL